MEENSGFISLKEVYHDKPYCDYIKRMCNIRDEEIREGKQESSVMNMLLMILKKINRIRGDVLKWLSEHYYPDWQVMRNLLYFVSKEAVIDWFQVFESILEKWKQNYQFVILFLTECQKAFELQLDVSDIQIYVEKSRNPHEFALMIKQTAEKRISDVSQGEEYLDAEAGKFSENNDNVIRTLTESIEFYKNQCTMQQAEIEALSKYKMEQELLNLQEKESSHPDFDALIEQQTQTIRSLEQENLQLRREYDSVKEQCKKAQLEIERLKESQADDTPEDKKDFCNTDMPEMPVSDKKMSFLSEIRLAFQQKRFHSLDEVRQREYIINHVMKNNIGDSEYMMLLKKLMNHSQIGLSFIFMLVKRSAKKEELQAALLLLDTPEKEDLEKSRVGDDVPLETEDDFEEEDDDEEEE